MALGYDTFEDDRDFEQKGLTGKVSRYTTEKMSFPCYIIDADSGQKVEAYKIKVLKNMTANIGSSKNIDIEDDMINLYFSQGGQMARLGKICPKQVKSFLKLFEGNKIDGFFDKDTPLNDDYLYVLAE